jgi:hypothetical protein
MAWVPDGWEWVGFGLEWVEWVPTLEGGHSGPFQAIPLKRDTCEGGGRHREGPWDPMEGVGWENGWVLGVDPGLVPGRGSQQPITRPHSTKLGGGQVGVTVHSPKEDRGVVLHGG